MNLAEVFTFLFVILGTLIVLTGYWLFAYALSPDRVARHAECVSRAPVKTILVGGFTLVPVVTLGLMLSEKVPNPAVKLVLIAIVLFALLGALLGSAGVAWRIGGGLPSARDEGEAWRRMLRGSVVLSLTFVLPFIGTFVMLPATLFAGFGVLWLGRKSRQPAPATAAAPAVPPLPTTTL